MLDLDEYQARAKATAVYPGKGTWVGLVYAALGLGETGELQGKVKKILRDDNFELSEDKRDALIGELGDVLWYCATMATELDILLSDVCRINLAKLGSRQERGVLAGSGDNR